VNAVPIRIKLTIAFATAMIVVLIAAGWFVYGRLFADLDETVDLALRARWGAALRLATSKNDLRSFPLEEVNEGFIQILDASGAVLSVVGLAGRSPLTAEELEIARAEMLSIERSVPGIEGVSRILAGPFEHGVLVAGQTLVNRDEALTDVLLSFAIGIPVAVVIASLVGYTLARSGLGPVESIRTAANEISRAGTGRRLPVPVARDEVRRLAETLNQMMDRLDDSAAREQQFVADAAHELRTPIAVARIELEAAQLVSGDTAPLESALSELDRLSQLAEDLLVIARISETGLPLVKQAVSPQTIIDSVKARFAMRAAAQARRIEAISPGSESIEIDPQRITQALANLVDNSLRHGKGDIAIRAIADGSAFVFEVIDEGEGFDSAFVDRAFERFSRGDAARVRGGAGLGLAIVKALAEAHGGSAKIILGEQTTIQIRLPR